MRACYDCLAVDYVTRFKDKWLCEKCIIFYDFDEELYDEEIGGYYQLLEPEEEPEEEEDEYREE